MTEEELTKEANDILSDRYSYKTNWLDPWHEAVKHYFDYEYQTVPMSEEMFEERIFGRKNNGKN